MKKGLFLLVLLLLPACATVQDQMVEDTLYFGLSTPKGRVTEAQWDGFLAKEVTPRFPDGLTVWDAKGQWKDAKGIIGKEPTKVLLLVHPAGECFDEAVQAIVEHYKKEFDQESVMRTTKIERVSF